MTTGYSEASDLSTYVVTERSSVFTWASAVRVGRGGLDSVVGNPLAAPTEEPRDRSRSLTARFYLDCAWNFSFLYSRDKWKAKSQKRIVRAMRYNLVYNGFTRQSDR